MHFFQFFFLFFFNFFSYIQKSLKFKKIKKDYQKKACERYKDIKIFLKKKKKKSSNMVVNVAKISDEKSNLVEYRKEIL